jgi:ribosomal protein L11 methyltransferase
MFHTRITVRCPAELTDILVAELAEAGFDAFMETPGGFEGYAEGEGYDVQAVEDIRNRYKTLAQELSFTLEKVEKTNWNAVWESSYEPVVVDDACLIRAVFHKPGRKYPYEIIITPKMSFGTGHHPTTRLMIRAQLDVDHQGKRVLDAGCGTAILSVMASKLGASEIKAVDPDEWSVINGEENARLNDCYNISLYWGTTREQDFQEPFDIILANINKNVLLEDMGWYAEHLRPGGHLLVSGFYVSDTPDILAQAARYNLDFLHRYEEETWVALRLQK